MKGEESEVEVDRPSAGRRGSEENGELETQAQVWHQGDLAYSATEGPHILSGVKLLHTIHRVLTGLSGCEVFRISGLKCAHASLKGTCFSTF